MKRVYYNKLVRDKIPEKIKSKGSALETHTLSDAEFVLELKKKIGEEAAEVASTEAREKLITELGDIIDVIEEIKKAENIEDTDIENARRVSLDKKGGFSKRLFLEWSEDDGYEAQKEKDK